ncbi:MAG: hypothetical protein K2N84_06580 [Clostridia bacterium]|nr:hypothetical protein [Clostridia bacterium]
MQTGTENAKIPNEKFKYRFPPTFIAMFCVGLLLSAAGFAINTWQLVGFLQAGDLSSVYEWMKYILLYLASGFLAVLIVSMLIRSQYVLTEKELIMQFGIVRSRYEIKKIYSVYLRSNNKLTVYFDDFKTKFIVVSVRDVWYDEFIKALLARNERIECSIAGEENPPKTDKKK